MNKFSADYQHLGGTFLKLIRENESFKKDVEIAFPEIYADIQSFSSNPNCTCKNKILSYVSNNKEKSANFLNEEVSKLSLDLDPVKLDEEFRNAAMKNVGAYVYRIKKSEWSDFPRKMMEQRVFIRSFSVVPVSEEEIDVYVIR